MTEPLSVKDNVVAGNNDLADKKLAELDEIFIGLSTELVLNILGSYIAHSFVEITNRNHQECFRMIEQFKIGTYKIAKAIIHDKKKINN